jgi:DNA-binding transcriptional LysR family regulator
VSLPGLRSFLAIAEHGSFAAAARALSLSQSAISTQMKALEAELRTPLFDRSRRPPVITDQGALVLGKARELIARYEDLQGALGQSSAIEGRLRLGAVGSILTGLMPAVLTAMRSEHPSVHVEIVSGFSQDLQRQVANGSLDAAVISDYDATSRALAWRPFLRERLVMITPPGARERQPKRLAQTYPFIRYSPNAPVGRIIDQALRNAGLAVRETMRLDWLEAIEAMVSHGHGISVVPERKFQGAQALPLRRIRLAATPQHRTLGLIEPGRAHKRMLTDALFVQLEAIARP